MVYALITAPTELAITLDDAKNQLNVELDFTDDDTLILSYIKAATLYVEKLIQGPVMDQVWELKLRDFKSEMEFHKGPVKAGTLTLKYQDANDAEQTVAASNYYEDLASVPARVILKSTFSIPTVFDRYDAVKIRANAGYTDASAVPEDLKAAIRLLVAHFYENRTPEITGSTTAKFSLTIERLLNGHMAWL